MDHTETEASRLHNAISTANMKYIRDYIDANKDQNIRLSPSLDYNVLMHIIKNERQPPDVNERMFNMFLERNCESTIPSPEAVDLNYASSYAYGMTVLMMAVIPEESKGLATYNAIVKNLLKKGADPNKKDDRGKTALTLAVIGGSSSSYLTMVDLVNAGASIDCRDYFGMTPLMYAAQGIFDPSEHNTIEILLWLGADPNIMNGWGYTALSYASMYSGRAGQGITSNDINSTEKTVRILLTNGSNTVFRYPWSRDERDDKYNPLKLSLIHQDTSTSGTVKMLIEAQEQVDMQTVRYTTEWCFLATIQTTELLTLLVDSMFDDF